MNIRQRVKRLEVRNPHDFEPPVIVWQSVGPKNDEPKSVVAWLCGPGAPRLYRTDDETETEFADRIEAANKAMKSNGSGVRR